jgi:hypothetical protein
MTITLTPSTRTSSITPTIASTGTGLDQLVSLITQDTGLIARISSNEINLGAAAADQMNQIIVEAIRATGVANNGDITAADVHDLNAWIKTHYASEWVEMHGDDERNQETGFHLVQGDGASSQLFDKNAVNTVADGIYHLGFDISEGRFLNEDGNKNVGVETAAKWLNELLSADLAGDGLDNATIDPYLDGTTGTGLDQLVAIIANDPGLGRNLTNAEISRGATAANQMNQIIVDAIRATGVANNGDISAADVRDLNAWIKINHGNDWVVLHGDDEDGEETGFHLVQNDGAKTELFGRNAVNTVADGIYHLGFDICEGHFLNEDGDKNVGVETAANWLDTLLAVELAGDSLDNAVFDPYLEGTTNTGLDQLVDIISNDAGLIKNISTTEIFHGATAANQMNQIIVDAIRATGVANNGDISAADVRDLNAWIKLNHGSEWVVLHGDDEDGEETGFHLVQNDGANSQLYGKNAVNTVADGIYHLGFMIDNNRLLNEDGDANAKLDSVAGWLNSLLSTDLASDNLDNALIDLYVEGTTSTGLDQLVNLITNEAGLISRITNSEIKTGALAANAMNHIIVQAIQATGAADEASIDTTELVDINAYIRANHLLEWTNLHGDDEEFSETGFHSVQNDGATTQLFGNNAVNTVADGLYHMGFEISRGRFLNEDGNKNASLNDVANWLNQLLHEDLRDGSLLASPVDTTLVGVPYGPAGGMDLVGI